jgi:hypothetical protein
VGAAKSILYCCWLFQCFRSHTLVLLSLIIPETAHELQ